MKCFETVKIVQRSFCMISNGRKINLQKWRFFKSPKCNKTWLQILTKVFLVFQKQANFSNKKCIILDFPFRLIIAWRFCKVSSFFYNLEGKYLLGFVNLDTFLKIWNENSKNVLTKQFMNYNHIFLKKSNVLILDNSAPSMFQVL